MPWARARALRTIDIGSTNYLEKEKDRTESQAKSDEVLASRPLDPTPSFSGRWALWVLLLIGGPAAGLVWVALRIESPPDLRPILDAMLQVCIGVAVIVAAYRLLSLFPYRTLDLLTIVVVLSAGLFTTLWILEDLSRAGLFFEGGLQNKDALGVVIFWCLMMSSVLLGGAALGMRFCERLGLDTPFARCWAVFCGMLALPAAAGMPGFGVFTIFELASLENMAPETNVYVAFWIGSCVVTCFNGYYFVHSLALKAEVK